MTSPVTAVILTPLTISDLFRASGFAIPQERLDQLIHSIPEQHQAVICPSIHKARNNFLWDFGIGRPTILQSYLEGMILRAEAGLRIKSATEVSAAIESASDRSNLKPEKRRPLYAQEFVNAVFQRMVENLGLSKPQ